MHDPILLLSSDEAPRRWSTGRAPAPPATGAWSDAFDAVAPEAGATLHVGGGEPLALDDLDALMDRATAGGIRLALHTDLPGCDDDQVVRPFSAHDVTLHVHVPACGAAFDALTGASWEAVASGLNNLRAFGFPVVLRIPGTAASIPHLAETVAHLLDAHGGLRVHLDVVDGDDGPSWPAVGDALLALDAAVLRPCPRVIVHGIPALALPLDQFTEVDVVVEDGPSTPWEVPATYLARHGDPSVDRDQIAARRAWLARDPKDRPGHRGDPRDKLVGATSVALLRPGNEVYAVVLPRTDGAALARGAHHALYVAGRFEDPVLQQRLGTIAKQVHTRSAGETLSIGRLRALAHVLRRALRPRHDEEPVGWYEEGEG